jgi:hypothetical protein
VSVTFFRDARHGKNVILKKENKTVYVGQTACIGVRRGPLRRHRAATAKPWGEMGGCCKALNVEEVSMDATNDAYQGGSHG